MELSNYLLEVLRKDEEFILYRGRGDKRAAIASLLLLQPVSKRPALECLKRMEHEHSLKAMLEPAWAVRPLTLSDHKGQMVLVLEDPGGEPLGRQICGPMEIALFLRLSLRLAGALRQLHSCGLIHKDIKPSNILVNPASGEVRLMGFGIASHVPRERQAPEPPEFIAGTLPYMAPEQTGRMNRSVDSRSDLYSLGIVLYQMLTGDLPFTASDPMEWVHCHIARKPIPPRERVKGVPRPISDIIMKLLAKTAEERYQTAAGIENDLRLCLTEWESGGRIREFVPGQHDAPKRLLIPEKLYGRAFEINTLLASFDRVAHSGKPELTLVSGYAGIGKSSVVQELHRSLILSRGLFASGKFDQCRCDAPYATLAQTFQSLIRPLLSKSEVELSQWRDALHEALGPNGRLITDLIPDLKLIVGEQTPVPEVPPQDAQGRQQSVFRRFICVFARPEHPLTLFLDDLQWLDAATLDLIEGLLTRSDVQYLWLIGAYRNNEVGASHPLMRKLEAVRLAGVVVQEILLQPLSRGDLEELVADAVHCDRGHATALAQLVHDKTSGNPFFAIQFMSALFQEGLLTFNHAEGKWEWDLNRIDAQSYTDNVVDLMIGKLSRLSTTTQNALQQLACMGSSAEFSLLRKLFDCSDKQMHDQLWEAVRAGLVFRSGNSYSFLHDRVQEAAYSLIPEELRAETHLRIGRLIAAETTANEREERIFEFVDQLNRGAALITAPDERERLAEFNLIAAQRAKNSCAYSAALNYVSAGALLLTEDAWELRHELIFALELGRAECEYLTGELATAEARLTTLSSHAADLVELATVTCLRVDLHTTLGQTERAVAICLDYLRHVDINWLPHPTEEEARREYFRIEAQLRGRQIKDLVDLPYMRDRSSVATVDVLAKVVAAAWFFDANLGSLAICKAVSLSIEHGNSDASCSVYVQLGMIAGPYFSDYKVGFEFGRVGCDLVEKRRLKRFQARAYLSFGNIVLPWTSHIRAGRDLVRRAFDSANEVGDLTFAGFSCNQLNTNLLAAGDPLAEVQREVENGLAFARNAQFGLVVDIITSQLQLVRTLRGFTPKFGCFNDEEFDEARFEDDLTGNPALAPAEFSYWVRKAQGCFLCGDYASAIDASAKAQRLLGTSPSFFEAAEFQLYAALSRAALWDSASSDEKQQHFNALTDHYKQLEIWSANCPDNFENRTALVGAEIARIEGREFEAMRLYKQAIRSAHENKFVHNEALAYEIAARFYASRGFDKIAQAYLSEARYCYLRWGADGKVRQLEERYPDVWPEEPAANPSTSTIEARMAQLDLATVLKVSQAISGEMVQDKLIDTLMRTAIEHAGAERGLLILVGKPEQVEAAATISGDSVVVRRGAAAASTLPESIIHFVVRTRDWVILEDAATHKNPFSSDPYFQGRSARSIICLPLSRQDKLIGILYLENNLMPNVFTPSRTAVLKLLAFQAAVSLENTRLYTDLEVREAKIRRLFDANIMGIVVWSVHGSIVDANDAFLRMVGYDRDDLLSGVVRWNDLTPAEWVDRDVRAIADLRAGRTVQPYEKELFRKDGGRLPVLVGGALFKEGGDEGVAFVLDLSERRYEEERYRVVVETANDAVISADESGAILFANPATTRVFGHLEAELIGEPLTVLMPEVFRKLHEEGFRRYLATGQRHMNWQGTELVGLRKSGEEFPVEVSFGELARDGHQVFTGFIRDISERKRAEEALRRSEERWRAVFENSAIGVALTDLEGHFIAANSAYQKMLGYTEEELRKLTFVELTHQEFLESNLRQIEELKRGTKAQFQIEKQYKRKDGSWLWVTNNVSLVPGTDLVPKFTLSLSEDITKRKQAEQAFRLLVVGTAATTGSDFFQSLVQHMAQALGARYAFVTACDDQKHARSLAFWNGGRFGDNFEFDIADTPCKKVLHGEVCHYRQGLQGLFPLDKGLADWQAESYLGVPMLDHSNRVIGHIAILDDKPMDADPDSVDLIKIFASRAAAELKRQRAENELQAALQERERLRGVQADLAHINRVSTMGELAASLAHEIKQPISAAITDAQTCIRWLMREHPDLAEAQEAASRLIKDATRAGAIINRIGSLFKKGVPQRELLDLNTVIEEMAALLLSEAARYSISIRCEVANDLPRVMADRVQVQQVLMNLMLNGIEAMKDGVAPGVLTITSERQKHHLLVSVRDTGLGLKPEQVEQIFHAFYTSKPQGTGMGLPISRSIIESHGGRLWATASSGPGAKFFFTLPIEVTAEEAA